MINKTDSAVFPVLADLIRQGAELIPLNLKANQRNISITTGNQRSFFKTRGMNFDEVRPYQQGDDSRQIDWRVTAKHGRPFTKVYIDDTLLQVYVLTDFQNQMFFASHGEFKSVVAAKINALISWLTLAQKENLHHIVFSSEQVKTFKPIQQKENLTSFFKQLIKMTPKTNNPQTDLLPRALDSLKKELKTGSLIFLLSDFSHLSGDIIDEIKQIGKKHTLVFIHIYDLMEENLPAGVLNFTDGKNTVLLDTHSLTVRKSFERAFKERQDKIQHLVKSCHGVYLPVHTNEQYTSKITKLLIKKGVAHGK